MLTSSFAPGAAAAKYWKVPLEASTRPETRPPSDCSHSSSARSGSIETLQRFSRSSVCGARLRGDGAEQLGQPALLAHLDDDRAQAAIGRDQAERGGYRRLADAALAGDHEQLAVQEGCHRRSRNLQSRR